MASSPVAHTEDSHSVTPPRRSGSFGTAESGSRWTRSGRWVAGAAVIVLLLAGAGLLIHAAGGSSSPAIHVLYFPILLAAILFQLPGALLTAFAAGLVAGPYMPFDVAEGTSQATGSWVLRTAIFLVVAAFVGILLRLLRQRMQEVEGLAEKVATVHAKTLATFATTVDLRDQPTGGHCNRVAHNARAVALELGLDEQAVRAAYWAGLLHDLGKIGVPEGVLRKPGPLTPKEMALMRRHSSTGAELLESVSQDFQPIARAVRSHHERWDGTGYPDGLGTTDIPMTGRLVAVVDVFEALTCSRPYRKPIPPVEALSYAREQSSKQFDPNIVPVLEDLYWRGEIFTASDPHGALSVEEPPPVEPGPPDNVTMVRGLHPRLTSYQLDSSGRP